MDTFEGTSNNKQVIRYVKLYLRRYVINNSII